MATTQLGLHPSFAALALISSSLTVFYALVEPTIFIPFLKAAENDAAAANKTCRLWWKSFLSLGLSTIFAIVPAGIMLGIYGAWHCPRGTVEWNLFSAGATFSAGHFLAVPTMTTVINNICSEEVERKGDTMLWLRKWLTVHVWRTMFADLPALVCFAWLVFGV